LWISDSEHHDSVSAINGLRRSAGPLTIEGATRAKQEEQMARQSKRERNAKQRERQKRIRDQYLREKRADRVEQIGDILVGGLVDQGFAERASYEVFDTLVERYRHGGVHFRYKVHLQA
jgi:hypothetical protein